MEPVTHASMEELERIPGTIVYTGMRSRRGYHLNQFCMSLMKADARRRFLSDEPAYLAEWPVTDAQKQAVLARDYGAMIDEGGNIFFILKIAATDGTSVQSVVASFTGLTQSDYAAMMLAGGRSPEAAPTSRGSR